jgi:hypothetical protein
MLEKRTSGGGVCVGGVVAYGRSQPADSTQHTAHSSGVDVDEESESLSWMRPLW